MAKRKLRKHRLKLILEIEYDINPDLYDTSDVTEMAKIDEQDYPEILDVVMENAKDDDVSITVVPVKKK